ncbi:MULTISPECIES: BrnA antitoxin family protein [Kaistia]|uniref:BrnA antitoxin family protein n=1 Tax=Kaistia nematophila TaxID=2994654 RepID=A0A9X3IIV9_9HYPH|nr:BrnA antitoxin family protein [Kaistia nematophila]MCX5567783.1 BrnA antitoxin family protein [Kaistia nematophila]
MSDDNMKKASLAEIREMKARNELFHDADAPEGESLGPDFWQKAMAVEPKQAPRSVHLKLDADVFDFFKAKGKGHLTRMQDVLRAYARAHRQS